VGDKNGAYLYQVADLSNVTEAEALVQAAVKKLGGLDYLVLNHMTNRLGFWLGSKQNLTYLSDVIQTNFIAYVHLASHAMSALERSGGSIIVMSSVAGRVSSPVVASYSSSKFALEGFFSALRLELQWRNTGVGVTMCSVGFVGTETALHDLKEFGLDAFLKYMKPARATDVALDIVRGGALRHREVKTPYMEVQLLLLLNKFAPSVNEAMTAMFFTPS